MYEVSCVAGNKVDAAYAVKSLGPMGGHSSSQKDHSSSHHHYKNHQKYYNTQQQYSTKQQTKDRHHQSSKRRDHNEPLYETEEKTPHKSEKDNGVKSHVLRLLRRSKSHSNAQQHLEKEQLHQQQQQLLAQQRHEDDIRQRDDGGNTKNRRRELDRRVMVTIVDGLPVVVTSRQNRAKVNEKKYFIFIWFFFHEKNRIKKQPFLFYVL